MTIYVAGGRGVAAGRGWDWIAAGWKLFKRQAGMWIALILVALAIFNMPEFIQHIPFIGEIAAIIGTIASFVFTPVFVAGIFIGCRTIEEGQELEIGHLFAGFREKFWPLATVGAICLGAVCLTAFVTGLATGADLFAILEGRTPLLINLLAVLVSVALMLPVMMAIWFAPALVVFHDKGTVDAMKESFTGCLRNVVPFLVYGVVVVPFLVNCVAVMLLGVLASFPLFMGWLVLGPVLAPSLYTSYKDIYLTA